MNHEHQPCGMCARFPAPALKDEGIERTGYCEGWERDVLSTDRPCVLFNERGTWQDRRTQQRIHEDQFARQR